MRRLVGVALGLAVLQGCGGRPLVANQKYKLKPSVADVPTFTIDTRVIDGEPPRVVVDVQQVVPCPRPVFEASSEPSRVCGHEPAAGVPVRIESWYGVDKLAFAGTTDSKGRASGPLVQRVVAKNTTFRLFVDDEHAGSADAVSLFARNLRRPAPREVERAPAPRYVGAPSASGGQGDATGFGSAVNDADPCSEVAGAAGDQMPTQATQIRSSREHVITRLIKCGRLSHERSSKVSQTVSAVIESLMSNTLLGAQTASRLKHRGVARLRESIELVAMSGLTEYSLRLYFRDIDPPTCTIMFEVTMDECDALIATARDLRLRQAPPETTRPDALQEALLASGIEEWAAMGLAVELDTTMATAHESSTRTMRGVTLRALLQRCPSKGPMKTNVRIWQRGATPELARCLVRELEGNVAVIRDTLFDLPGLKPMPLAVVRQFVEWAQATP